MSDRYPIVIHQLNAEDGGGFMAFAPDLPGCLSDGDTQAEAVQNIGSAIQEWIDEASRLERPIPKPFSSRDDFLREEKELHEYIRKLMDVADRQAKALQEQSKTVDELNGELETLRAAFAESAEASGCTSQNMLRWRIGLQTFSGCVVDPVSVDEPFVFTGTRPYTIQH